MNRITRRSFLSRSAAAAGAGLVFSSAASRVLGANDDVRVAVVGFNGQGGGHIQRFLGIPGVRLVALCDADQAVIDRKVKDLDKKNVKVQTYQDVRKMLENKEIDAISTATPNHWHSLVGVWACQAGKDCYIEKPISHEIWEGRKLIECQKKYNRIVWHGTQTRSDNGLPAALDYIKQGNLGAVKLVRGFCYKPRPSIGKVSGPQPVPATVNYDLWCGPAPMEPLMRKKLHYDWHWVWPTGNGDIGNQGVHEVDMCRWALGHDALPERVFSFGGRFVVDDDATTPNTLVAYYDYKPVPMIFEVRGLPRAKDAPVNQMDAYMRTVRIGIAIHCEGGTYLGGAGGWIYDKDMKKVKEFKQDGLGDHQKNFIESVRTRKFVKNCDAHQGHYSASLCHLGNIPYRVGKDMSAGEIEDQVKGNADAMDSLKRMEEHLTNNGFDLGAGKITFGPWLNFDPKSEKFTGELADKANKFVTREYRAPYVLPESV